MSDPVWFIDFGNTRLKASHSDDEEPRRVAATSREAVETRNELFLSQWLSALAGRRPVRRVIAALARPGDGELVAPLLERFAPGATLEPITPAHLAPGRVLYTSGQPGPDRIANVLALRGAAPGRWGVAIDCGTATTLTVANPAGDLAGGAILPGLRTLARSLHRETGGRLPEIDPFKAPFPPAGLGNSTVGAIESGVLLGHAGAIEKVLQSIQSEIGEPLGCILATGGAAPKVLPLMQGWAARLEPTLTMDGLRCLWKKAG